MHLTIHFDGAARGNPGPAAFAYVITGEGMAPVEAKRFLGTATNNQAEYQGLVHSLAKAGELGGKRLTVYSDSELVVKQMNGQYKVKNEDLRRLYDQAKGQSKQFDLVVIRHVRREENRRADELCNQALDDPDAHTPTS
jgi:ribonuclease HI